MKRIAIVVAALAIATAPALCAPAGSNYTETVGAGAPAVTCAAAGVKVETTSAVTSSAQTFSQPECAGADNRETEEATDEYMEAIKRGEYIEDVGALMYEIGVLGKEPTDYEVAALVEAFGEGWRDEIERIYGDD